MKNVLKTLLLTIHTQLMINLIFFLMIQMGIKVFVFHDQAIFNTLYYALFLSFIYFVFVVLLSFIKPKILSYPFKAWALLILLGILYTLSFALAQSDFDQWRIFFIGHLGLGYFVRSWLPSQFDFTQQFLIAFTVLGPALGVKLAYELCTWLQYRLKKSHK